MSRRPAAWQQCRSPRDGESLKPSVEHAFRHHYGRLVSILARKVGARHIVLVEDAVQTALLAALTEWTDKGEPDDPTAWLYRVAWNRLLQDLRRASNRDQILRHAPADQPLGLPTESGPLFANEVSDDLLRMLFVACDEAIPLESRLVFALKTLCGFSTGEIALRLFTSEANVHKRLGRARDRLRSAPLTTETPPWETMQSRLPAVHQVLYLLFNEGYLSISGDEAIRRELCEEAIRLATLLAEHPVGALPETFALLALMHLHAARLDSRTDALGGLLLLEEQDRSRWDQALMGLGLIWLQRSATGDTFSRFHAEAGVAAEHCLAPSFRETRWDKIAELYVLLERSFPSPLHTLNRAIAVAESQGPQAGLALLGQVSPPSWLSGSYLWPAVLSDLHRRSGNSQMAAEYRENAISLAPSDRQRELLRRRLGT